MPCRMPKWGKLVTFGIVPDLPETGYGYIVAVKCLRASRIRWPLKWRSFVEKPNLETAQAYVASGEDY
ncbi:sugar phosphate nucleotidyltransferase [Escherichia coli]